MQISIASLVHGADDDMLCPQENSLQYAVHDYGAHPVYLSV